MSTEPDKATGCPIENDKSVTTELGECGDNNSEKSDDCKEKKKIPRSVRFPGEDQLVTQYFEPANPWHDVPSTTKSQLAAEYLESCRRHNTPCIDSVLQQIRDLPDNTIGGSVRAPRLTLAECSLSGAARADALEAVMRKVQFRRLEIEHAVIDDEGAEALFDMIEYYESATVVSISGPRQFGIRGWQAASRMIKKSAELSELEVSDAPLEASHAPVLARSLRAHSCTLRALCLQRVSLCGEPLLCLVIALKSNSSIRELRLGDNRLAVSDAAQLASLLRYNTRIQLLDLSNNQIQDAGTAHIADALAEQASQSPPSAAASPLSPHRCQVGGYEARGLAFLVLWNNQLTRNCAPYLSKALRSCSSLCVLNVGRNALGSEAVRALGRGGALVSLGLQAARLGPDAAAALADLLRADTKLQRLDLRENRLGSAGLQAILSAMKDNRTLTQIDLDEPPSPDSTNLTPEDTETSLVRRLTREIRAACVNNEPPSRHDEDSSQCVHRKISLTCHTACLLTQVMGGCEEERRSRLRSPAPSPAASPAPSPAASPAPSPAGSPVPAPHPHSRFMVTRVTPERDSSSDSSGSTSSSSTPTRLPYCPPSRFRVVQVMEPPQIQVHPATNQPRKSPSRFSVSRNYDSIYNPAPTPPSSPAQPIVYTQLQNEVVTQLKNEAMAQHKNESPTQFKNESLTQVKTQVQTEPKNNDLSVIRNELTQLKNEVSTQLNKVLSQVRSDSEVKVKNEETEIRSEISVQLKNDDLCLRNEVSTQLENKCLTCVKNEGQTQHKNVEQTQLKNECDTRENTEVLSKISNDLSYLEALIQEVSHKKQDESSKNETIVQTENTTQHENEAAKIKSETLTQLKNEPTICQNKNEVHTQLKNEITTVKNEPLTVKNEITTDLTSEVKLENPVKKIITTQVRSELMKQSKAAAKQIEPTLQVKNEITVKTDAIEKPETKTESKNEAPETILKNNVTTQLQHQTQHKNEATTQHQNVPQTQNKSDTKIDSTQTKNEGITVHNIVTTQLHNEPNLVKVESKIELKDSQDSAKVECVSNIDIKSTSSVESKNTLVTQLDTAAHKNIPADSNIDSKTSNPSTEPIILKNEAFTQPKTELAESINKVESIIQTNVNTNPPKAELSQTESQKSGLPVESSTKSEHKTQLRDIIDNTPKIKTSASHSILPKTSIATIEESSECEFEDSTSTTAECIPTKSNAPVEYKSTEHCNVPLNVTDKNVIDSVKVNLKSDLKYSDVLKSDVRTVTKANVGDNNKHIVSVNVPGELVLEKNKSESSLDSPDLEVLRLMESEVSVFDSNSSLEVYGSSMESLTEQNKTQELDRRKSVVLSNESSLESASDVTPVNSNLLNLSVSSNESVSPIFGKTKVIHDSLSSLEASVSSLDSGKQDKIMVTSADSGIEYSLQHPSENREDNSSNEGTLTNNSSLKDSIKKPESFNLVDLNSSPKRTSSLLDVPALKNKGLDRMRKISWVAPSSSFHIPRPEEKEAKPSHLEKLLSIFQHPSSIFSRSLTSDDDKKTTSSTPPRKDSTLTSSFWSWGSAIEKDREEDSSEATDSTLSERVQVSFVDESFSRKLDSKTPSTDTDNTLSEFQSLGPQESDDRVTINTTEDNIVQNVDLSVISCTKVVAKSEREEKEIARPRSFAAVLKSSGSENSLEKPSPDNGQPVDKLPSKVIRGIKENISPENTLTSSMTNTKALAVELERQVKNPTVNIWEVTLKSEPKTEDVKVQSDLAPIATIDETLDEDNLQLAYIDDVKDSDRSIDSGVTLEAEKEKSDIDLGKDALSYLIYENRDFEIGAENIVKTTAQQGSLAEELKQAEIKEILDLSPELVVDDSLQDNVFTAKEIIGLRTSPIIPERAKLKKANSLEDLSLSDEKSPKVKTIAFKVPESTTPRDIPERRAKLRTRSGSSPKSLPESLNKPCPLTKMESVLTKKKKKVSSLGKMARDSLLALNMTEDEISEFRRSYKLTSVESLKSLESVSESGNSVDSRCRACLRQSQESLMSLDSISEDCRCTDDCEKPGKSAR